MNTQPVTFADICAGVWRARLFILSGVIIAGLVAAFFLITAVPRYKSVALLSPANAVSGLDASSLFTDDSLSALRYLVQRTGVTNSADFVRFENTYDGTSVAGILLQDRTIARGIGQDRRFTFSSVKQHWAPEELADYIARTVRLEPVGGSALRRMVYTHPDRSFASYFLTAIHRVSDELIRQKASRESASRVEYLKQSLSDIKNPEHRRALTALLMEQERLNMLVTIDASYAAAMVEPPSAGVKPWWPDVFLIISGFFFIGACAGFVVFSVVNAVKQKPVIIRSPRAQMNWFRTDSGNSNTPRGPLPARDKDVA